MIMANRSPQTQEKRQRERAKQVKRQEKLAKKLERNAAKRDARQNGEIEGVPIAELSRDPLDIGAIVITPVAKTGDKP